MKSKLIDQINGSFEDPLTKKICTKETESVTEFIGTAAGGTIGLVIASVDLQLIKAMELKDYHSIGIIGSRSGFGPQVMAVDKAIKETNIDIIKVEVPRDLGTGPGSYIVVGGKDVSDVRQGVEVALDAVEKYYGDIYMTQMGRLEFQYSAHGSYCIEKIFDSPVGEAFGLISAGPAAIGTVLADVALKSGDIEIVSYSSPSDGKQPSYSNEVMVALTGDAGAVQTALKNAMTVGKKLLGSLGSVPESLGESYI